jgi:hypothetical protein
MLRSEEEVRIGSKQVAPPYLPDLIDNRIDAETPKGKIVLREGPGPSILYVHSICVYRFLAGNALQSKYLTRIIGFVGLIEVFKNALHLAVRIFNLVIG